MAIIFTATNSHLRSTSTNFTASTVPFSISVWVNAIWNSGRTISMVGMYNGTSTSGTTTGLQIGTATGTGEITCWTYGGTAMVSSATGVMTQYNNKWINTTYTYNGTTHYIYVNGVQLNTGTTAQISGTFTQVWINGYPPTGNANETSTISVDSYTYYNRQLSSDEVLTIYNSAGTRHGIFNGVLARYEFDELGQGATVVSPVDLSGNGNNLTFVGTAAAPLYTYTTSYANSNARAPL